MRKSILCSVLALGLVATAAHADLDMTGWSQSASMTGMVWQPTGGGYGSDGYGASSDTGHWGQASGGYKYSVNQLSVWNRGSEVRVVAVSGMRWKGHNGFDVGDLRIDTNGDGNWDAALRRPDLVHDASSTDFTHTDGGDPLLVRGLEANDWRAVTYQQFPTGPYAVKDGNLNSSNAWETTEVTFDYDYRAAGAPDPLFYEGSAGDRSDFANDEDYLYAWTFDTALLGMDFTWAAMGLAMECGNDGINMPNPIPAPGAILLGVLGLTVVGRARKMLS